MNRKVPVLLTEGSGGFSREYGGGKGGLTQAQRNFSQSVDTEDPGIL